VGFIAPAKASDVRRAIYAITLVLLGALIVQSVWGAQSTPVQLLNASYDLSRELFTQINPVFAAQWKAQSGQSVTVRQSHGGSSAQARAVAEGLQADVVTFNQATDIEVLRKAGLVADDWRNRMPDHASPYYSLLAVEDTLGGWDQVTRAHFAEGGILDKVVAQH
jgi:sulfate transport system substrate-binding protein